MSRSSSEEVPTSPTSLSAQDMEPSRANKATHAPAGPHHWSAFFHQNAVQRTISAIVLAPAVTIFLWLSPAFATTTVCSFMISTCSYEYACLSHRIRLRILTQMKATEGLLTGNRSTPSIPDIQRTRSGTFALKTDDNYHDARSSTIVRADAFTRSRNAHVSYVHARAVQEEQDDHEIAIADDELRDLEGRLHRCAVTGLALEYFRGHVWFAALCVSIPVCILITIGFLHGPHWSSQLRSTEFYEYRWFYAISTGYVAALCACLTPDWQYATVTLIKYGIFTILTMLSTACPMNELNCSGGITASNIFLGGMLIILLFRLASTRSRFKALISLMLDVVGLVYVTGTLSILVAFVDDKHRVLYRKLLLALLCIVWASDTGAYVVGKVLDYVHYPFYNPLAAHLSKSKDYEGTFGAILFGVVTMVVISQLLDLPGSYGMKVSFTVVAVVVGRMGDLFESLLKRAAGVKDSGRLIPGHGGVLDRIDALMFATLVFSRYYALQT